MTLEELIEKVVQSGKYADLHPDLIRRVCEETVKKYGTKSNAVKEAKKELHIIYDSFLIADGHKQAKKLLSSYNGTDILSDKEFASELMHLHVSTKERLENAAEIYAYIGQFIHQESSVCDVGCGFNPFALPFLTERPARYKAYEIGKETVEVLNLYFSKTGKDCYAAALSDAVCETPADDFDVLLAFKLLPVLQQQKKGRAMEFLQETSFSTAVISFPTRSLSGRNKGMESFYSTFFETALPQNITICDKTVLYNELFYVLKKE